MKILLKEIWMVSILTANTLAFALSIPPVGTGRRTQYHIQNRDGTFKYGHDTGEGAYENVERSRDGKVDGEFGYAGENGNTFMVQYVVGSNDFMEPQDDYTNANSQTNALHSGLSTHSSAPFTNLLANSNIDEYGGSLFPDESTRPAYQQPIVANHHFSTIQGHSSDNNDEILYGAQDTRSSQRLPGETAQIRNTYTPDGSHSWNYETSSHQREESRDSQNRVTGSFAFEAGDDGLYRNIRYEAGSGTGFVVEGDHLPVGPAVPGAPSGKPTGRLNSNYPIPVGNLFANPVAQETQGRYINPSSLNQAASDIQTSVVTRQSSSSYGSSATNFHHVGTYIPGISLGNHFHNYETPSHERKETLIQNKSPGNFAFTADGEMHRALEYEANAGTSFVADGDYSSMGPEVSEALPSRNTARLKGVRSTPFNDPLANPNSDASYNFAFNTEQYSRTESSDPDGNIQGMYTIVEDDGTRRTHNYRAGKGTRFEIQQADVSKGPRPTRLLRPSPEVTSDFRATSSGFPGSTVTTSNEFPGLRSQILSSSPQEFDLQQTFGPDEFGYVLTFSN